MAKNNKHRNKVTRFEKNKDGKFRAISIKRKK